MSAMCQQQGGISLRAFAVRTGFSERYILNCARSGRIFGARQNSRSKKWTIYPPAKLVDKAGDPMKRREAAAGFDFGTSPHGLASVGQGGELCGVQPYSHQDRKANFPSLEAGVKCAAKPEAARPDSPRPGRVSPGELPINSWLAMLPEGMR